MRIVIIGGVAAGAKAAAKAQRVNPEAEILIYQDEAEVSYSACGEPYVISGVIADAEQLLIRRADEFAESGVQVYTRHRVTDINPAQQQLSICNLSAQQVFTDHYDRLIIAIGASPVIPPIDGTDREGVLCLRSWTQFQALLLALTDLKPKHAVIIGTGYISMELAEAFCQRAIHTTIIGRSTHILSQYDADMAKHVQTHLQSHGVELQLGVGVKQFIGKQKIEAVELNDGCLIPADLVVLATGIRANSELAKQAGLELGNSGAIKVNHKMQTSNPFIYAAGDCCETFNLITQTAFWQPLGDIANLQGRVAGENAAGGNASFPGVLGTSIVKVFDFNVAITGLSETKAVKHGFKPLAVTVKAMNKARYYSNAQFSYLKLIADVESGRLLGAQAVGLGASDKLIDIVATALLGKLTCEEMENADLAYSPPFSPVLSPVILAAGVLAGRWREQKVQ
jgi:NADPH-dependent 2,4-dienoyl-CoA reductase/sulfur reductase-like enzyme